MPFRRVAIQAEFKLFPARGFVAFQAVVAIQGGWPFRWGWGLPGALSRALRARPEGRDICVKRTRGERGKCKGNAVCEGKGNAAWKRAGGIMGALGSQYTGDIKGIQDNH